MFRAGISWPLSIVGQYHCHRWDDNLKPISITINQELGSSKVGVSACCLSAFLFTIIFWIFTDHQTTFIYWLGNPICEHALTDSKEKRARAPFSQFIILCEIFLRLPDKHAALSTSLGPPLGLFIKSALIHGKDIGPLSTVATKYPLWTLFCKKIMLENFPSTFCNVDGFSLGPVFLEPP